MSTFLRTFSLTKPLAPAHLIREAPNTGVGDYQLIDVNATFLSLAGVEPGTIVVNVTDGGWAKVVKVVSNTTLQLDKHIFSATPKTYRLLMPARGVVTPGAGQEIILFRLWARNVSDGKKYPVLIYKEAFSGFQTQPIAETDPTKDTIDETKRLLPTDTEFYVFENGCLTRTDYVVEGLDKTLSSIQIEAATT